MSKISLLKYSLNNLRHRKLRSFLTIISVLIGITAIFVLISFGQGLSSYVDDISAEMGKDKLLIQPRGQSLGGPNLDSNFKLTDDDLDFIEDIRGVEEATGVYMSGAEIEFDDQKKFVYISGSDFKDHPELISEVYTLEVEKGDGLRGRERTKAALGYNYQIKDKIFDREVRIGDKVLINGEKIKVAGFFEEVGNPIDDANIYLTIEGFEKLYDPDTYQFILIRSSPGVEPEGLAEHVKEEFRNYRDQSEGNEDFFVQTFEQVIATFNNILAIINGILILVAMISIFVASVNIMNTMYTAVLERTKEIGVMKSIGATNGSILFIFVMESGLLSLLGGVLGVVIGFGVSSFAGAMIERAGYGVFQPAFPWYLIVGCLVFSFLIGFFSGWLPARQASKLKPVDALRYE